MPATARLVVLDQKEQDITFMNFDGIVGSSWVDDDCESSSSPGHERAVTEVGQQLGELRLSVPHHTGSAVMVHVCVPETCPQGADSGTAGSIRGAELPPELFAAAPAPAPAGPMVEGVPVAVLEMDQQQLQWHEDVAADLQPDEQRKLQVGERAVILWGVKAGNARMQSGDIGWLWGPPGIDRYASSVQESFSATGTRGLTSQCSTHMLQLYWPNNAARNTCLVNWLLRA